LRTNVVSIYREEEKLAVVEARRIISSIYDGHDATDAVLSVSYERIGFIKIPPTVSERVSRSARGALA
jgi:hypothetical protein